MRQFIELTDDGEKYLINCSNIYQIVPAKGKLVKGDGRKSSDEEIEHVIIYLLSGGAPIIIVGTTYDEIKKQLGI